MSRLLAVLLGMLLGGGPALAAPADLLGGMRRDLTALDADLLRAQERLYELPVSRIQTELAHARLSLDTADQMIQLQDSPDKAQSWLTQARDAMVRARIRVMPSRTVEARGIFLDAGSLPKTPEGMRQLVGSLAKANFNLLMPEVFRRGYTLYSSRLTDQDPEFRQGPDLLRVLVDEAHRYGMEVHPWVWTLRVRSPGFGNPVLDRLPALASRQGSATEPRFLSAAEPRARQWIGMLVDEMFAKYAFDGLMLDYIRYDEQIPEDELSRTHFALDYLAKHGQYPPNPIPPHSPAAVEWQAWREEQVNLLVREISSRLKARSPRLKLSVSTFRGESFARLTKMQHWRHWVNNRWVNIVTSMLYTSKTEELATWLSWETDGYRRPNLLYPILGPHRMNEATWETLDQIQALQQKHQPGVLFFAMSHMRPGMLEALAEGPFRRKAQLPHANLALAAKRILQDLDGDYLRRLTVTGDWDLSASARALSQEVQAISSLLPTKDEPFTASDPVLSRLEGLKGIASTMVAKKQLPAAVSQELGERITYAHALMRAHAHEVAARGYIPSTRPPIEVKVDFKETRD